MERKIKPVQPIKKTRAVREVQPVRLHHRPRYKSRLNADLFEKKITIEKPEAETGSINHAHYVPEGVGEHIDFKT
ncbi:Hypothetical protein LUCI_2446 [Lucifera butyrica]|uniref:Uncharacterized protein n=1 Tax=Lucifera butyrica TaxID=1351585 RepID=A0A498RA88_9FIRM|nr:hypothetical protein [Lucifera butyrica]VBB07202.1 Hypothetical protein LUCI_2446 [Lucifera butyrica]